MQNSLRRLGCSFIAVLVLVTVGCSGDVATSPIGAGAPEWQKTQTATPMGKRAPTETPEERWTDLIGGTSVEVGDTTTVNVSELISASKGGVIWAGRYQLTIPARALREDTVITIRQTWQNDGVVGFELLPHGLQFRKAVDLRVWLGDKAQAGDAVSLYWWDAGAADYVDMGGTWAAPYLTTQIWHFSQWKAGRAGW